VVSARACDLRAAEVSSVLSIRVFFQCRMYYIFGLRLALWIHS